MTNEKRDLLANIIEYLTDMSVTITWRGGETSTIVNGIVVSNEFILGDMLSACCHVADMLLERRDTPF